MAQLTLCYRCSSKVEIANFVLLNFLFGLIIFLITIAHFKAVSPLVIEIDGKPIKIEGGQAINFEDCQNPKLLVVKIWIFHRQIMNAAVFLLLFGMYKVNIVLASNLSFSCHLLLTETPSYEIN